MPANGRDLQKVARKLGFHLVRQKGSHARWRHPDGRATTIPVHGNSDIGNWLFYEIIKQLGITEEKFKLLLQ